MAGYYSCLSYSTAQLLIEVPYLLGLSIMFVSIIYPMIGFQWTAGQFFWCVPQPWHSLRCSLCQNWQHLRPIPT